MERNIKILADLYAGAAGLLPKYVPEPVTSRNYAVFLEENAPSVSLIEAQRKRAESDSADRPMISVIMIGNDASACDIDASLLSLIANTLKKWELILTLSLSCPEQERYARIENVHTVISDEDEEKLLESAQTVVRGGAVMLLKPGDILSCCALYYLAERLFTDPNIGFVYADSDIRDEDGKRSSPVFKPGFSPVTEISCDYIKRPLLVRTKVHLKAGGFTGTDADAHHRYVLDCINNTERATNVSKVLLSALEESKNDEDTHFTVNSELEACPGAFRGSFALVSRKNRRISASIIIAGPKDLASLRRCLETIDNEALGKPKLVVSAGKNVPDELDAYLDALKRNKAAIVIRSDSASVPALLNEGACRALSEYMIFLSPNALIITPDFIERLTDPLCLKNTAVCGGKLLGPDGTLCHTGTVIGLNGYAASIYEGTEDDFSDTRKGFYTAMIRNVTAVSGSFMAVSGEDFASIGMFDETLPEVGWDTEFCIRASLRGKNTVYTPFASAKLTELPPAFDTAPKANLDRFLDAAREHMLFGDPYYSINYDYRETAPRLAIRPAPPIEYGLIRH